MTFSPTPSCTAPAVAACLPWESCTTLPARRPRPRSHPWAFSQRPVAPSRNTIYGLELRGDTTPVAAPGVRPVASRSSSPESLGGSRGPRRAEAPVSPRPPSRPPCGSAGHRQCQSRHPMTLASQGATRAGEAEAGRVD